MKNRILNLINKINFDQTEGAIIKTKVWSDIYTYNDLLASGLSKAKAVATIHNLSINDEILLLIQNGFTEKDSVVITEQFISIVTSNWFSKNEIKKIEWANLSEIKLVNHQVIFTYLDGSVENIEIENITNKNKGKEAIVINLFNDMVNAHKNKDKFLNKTTDLIQTKSSFVKKYQTPLIVAGLVLLLGISALFFDNDNSNFSKNTEASLSQDSIVENTIPTVVYDTLWSDKPQEGYTDTLFIRLKNIFNEPYSLTLNSSGFLSEGDKIIVPIELPKNTDQWFYKLKIANTRAADSTKFVGDVSYSIKQEINKKGKMTEEKVIESNLLREVLNSINTPSKEVAYVNAYFINDKKEALNFQEEKPFKYDIDNSIKNTHSRTGLIKYTKNPNMYLGFENEKFPDNVYVFVEAVAVSFETKYYKLVERVN